MAEPLEGRTGPWPWPLPLAPGPWPLPLAPGPWPLPLALAPGPGLAPRASASTPSLAEVPQQADAYAGGAWSWVVGGDVGLVAVGVGSARDIEMGPRYVAHELLQEQAGRDGAGAAATGGAHDGPSRLDIL